MAGFVMFLDNVYRSAEAIGISNRSSAKFHQKSHSGSRFPL
jgi:hypothetical protein